MKVEIVSEILMSEIDEVSGKSILVAMITKFWYKCFFYWRPAVTFLAFDIA